MHGPLLPRPRIWAEAALQKKTRFTLIGELLVFLIVFSIAYIAQTFLVTVTTVIWMLGSKNELMQQLSNISDLSAVVQSVLESLPDWVLFVSLFSYAMFGFAAILYCRKFEKRSLATMGLVRGGVLAETVIGAVIGLLLVAAVVGIGVAAKGFRVGAFSLQTDSIPILLIAVLGYIVEVASLELLYRGYLATSLGTRVPVAMTVFFSSLIPTMVNSGLSAFSMLGFINSLLLSILLTIYMIKRGSLWGVCGMHAMWNIGLYILCDFIMDGSAGELSVLPVFVVPSNAVLTGGELGPEASICTTIALLAAIAAILALKAKDPAPPEPAPEPGIAA